MKKLIIDSKIAKDGQIYLFARLLTVTKFQVHYFYYNANNYRCPDHFHYNNI